jgi:hypothetical protein
MCAQCRVLLQLHLRLELLQVNELRHQTSRCARSLHEAHKLTKNGLHSCSSFHFLTGRVRMLPTDLQMENIQSARCHATNLRKVIDSSLLRVRKTAPDTVERRFRRQRTPFYFRFCIHDQQRVMQGSAQQQPASLCSIFAHHHDPHAFIVGLFNLPLWHFRQPRFERSDDLSGRLLEVLIQDAHAHFRLIFRLFQLLQQLAAAT